LRNIGFYFHKKNYIYILKFSLLFIYNNYTMNLLIRFIIFFIISITSLNAETVAVKCHIDEEHSYSFLFNFNDKKATWLDQNNQDMIITIFPDVEKGGKLLIMGGVGKNNEKHTFIIDVVKAVVNVSTNLGFHKSGKCGNKSIIEPKDPYAD
tara:strand:- start:16525 stop:16980 length:456 start_codon:yes stop_codon:yes gene_type:complete